MLDAYTAFTSEIDEVDAAVEEILSQLDLSSLRQNSVGILSCYSEFIDSGVVAALSARLPFPIVGTTTLATAVNGGSGQLVLALLVLTGEGVRFSAAVSGSLKDDMAGPVTEAYESAARQLPGPPALVLTFAPLMYYYAGDQYVELLGRLSGGAPCFGTLAVDHTADYGQSQTIFGANAYRDALALVLVQGDVAPAFFVGSLSEGVIRKQTAVVTASEGNILQGVNGVTVAEYLETIGLAKGGQIVKGYNSIPFIIDYNDGTQPIARALFAITPEGYGVCGGLMPVGSTLSIGALDRGDVMSVASDVLQRALSSGRHSAALIYSCIGRNLALGVDTLAEAEQSQAQLSGRLPFLYSYSGGEICPVTGEAGSLQNRFHNITFVACLL